ncbi:MAG: HD domain-containing protein [Desulfobacteraceae bacterium]|nr:HD domain-containing protein [Desulfobacteraceae bacterium]
MKLDRSFFRSKVAHRIFVLFVLCALLPILTLAVYAFGHVTRQLNEQTHLRIQRESKSVGMAVLERLLFLEREMVNIQFQLNGSLNSNVSLTTEGFRERFTERFSALALIMESGRHVPLFGQIENPPELDPTQTKWLEAGKTVLSVKYRQNAPPQVFMIRLVDIQDPLGGILLGEINTFDLWGVGETYTLPAMIELCVLDESNNVLFSSVPLPENFSEHIVSKTNDSKDRRFEWEYDGEEYLASYWTIFLKPRYSTLKWTVALSQSKAVAFAPLAYFKKTFFLVVLLSVWVVLFLSIVQIRRNLIPLEKLKEGTVRIGNRDFDTRVSVTSGDEFEELANSFNEMSSRLGKQFSALKAIAEIDRAILGILDTDKILNTILTRMGDVVPCQAVSVSLLDLIGTGTVRTYTRKVKSGSRRSLKLPRLKPDEVQTLNKNLHHLFIDVHQVIPSYLKPLVDDGLKSFLVLPIFLKEQLAGIISLGFSHEHNKSEEDVTHARQLADQASVALSNVHLVDDLAQLNWGTLIALARAVDAKSPWTAGHSERVTDLALKIGQAMGLEKNDLDVLRRAGLLHDIGKIGTPAAILEKKGKLTDEEYQIVKNHPAMGARILEPISAYAQVIPMVEQHHEKFDGTGYPHGLSGEAICLGGRILALADVFDALTSDRPYRPGWELERAYKLIREESGRNFDPKVVEAFFEVVARTD